MKNCKTCSSNDWQFKADGDHTVVRCRKCKNEFRFLKKKAKKKERCNECKSTNIVREKLKIVPELLLERSYFLYWYVCKKCGARKPDPTTKRYNQLFT